MNNTNKPDEGKMTEVELAEKVIGYYEGHEIYKEQTLGGNRCDIVATTGCLIIAVECKLQFSINLISQAWRHFPYCNYSFVAVPANRGQTDAIHICERLGIGVIRLEHGKYVTQRIPAKYRRVRGEVKLNENQKYAIAGAQANSMSAYKMTVRAIESRIQDTGSISIKELFQDNSYHWGSVDSAKQCFMKYLRKGLLPQFQLLQGKIKLTTP